MYTSSRFVYGIGAKLFKNYYDDNIGGYFVKIGLTFDLKNERDLPNIHPLMWIKKGDELFLIPKYEI